MCVLSLFSRDKKEKEKKASVPAEWLPAAVFSPCGRGEGMGALLWDAAGPCRNRPLMLLLKWLDSVCIVLVKAPVLWVGRWFSGLGDSFLLSSSSLFCHVLVSYTVLGATGL